MNLLSSFRGRKVFAKLRIEPSDNIAVTMKMATNHTAITSAQISLRANLLTPQAAGSKLIEA